MDSLTDILSRKDFDEPMESTVIKKYVHEKFNETVAITIHEREIIIATPSAALASTLRFKVLELRKLLDTKKRLVFRVGK